MSRPHAAGSAVQPNAASTAQPSGNVAAQPYAQTSAAALAPRLDPIPIPTPFAAPFHPLGAPPPAPYPAPFHHTWRPPFFPPVMPPGAFPGPSVYRLPPPPPGLFGPYPGAPFLPHVDPRYFTQYPIRPGPPGSPRSFMYPPGVFSHQQPAVVHEIFDPVAAARPPLPPVAPQFKVYIGKIASTVDKDFVLSLLQVCGPVKSWEPVTNPIDGTPTAFGFCEFEFAESSLRARRLLNKLSVDGQELVLNVNQATRDYGESTIEEKANEADMDAIQKIRSLIEERMKSKLPGSPIPPVQMSASASIVDENDDGDTRSSALEETKIRRQCEKEEHLGESKAVGLQDRKDREATAARKSSLQVDALNINAATGECLQKYGQSTTEEKANEVGKDVTQKIHSTIEERMKSKFPGSPSPPIQVSASIVDENGDADSRSIALEERKIRRQCEEVHLGERKAVGLQCWKDKEVTAPGRSSLQIDGASTMYAPMECESTVENGRKSQHMERDGFHKSNGKERHIVFVPGLFSDDENSSAGEKVGCELEATAKSGDNKTLDAKQLLGTVPKSKEELKQLFATVPKTKEELKQLLATVPKTKEELFAHDVNWAIYDEHGLHERMRPWISRKSTEVIGEELPEFVDYVVETTKEHVDAPRMVELLLSILDEYAERFVLLMWRKLIFEIKRVETELA